MTGFGAESARSLPWADQGRSSACGVRREAKRHAALADDEEASQRDGVAE
jgi:hypothetical protein